MKVSELIEELEGYEGYDVFICHDEGPTEPLDSDGVGVDDHEKRVFLY